jgi:N-acyl-D-amino-acid deacylase
VDGTGGPPFTADLGIAGDTIAAVGQIAAEQGRQVLDARGLVVSPGFIDIHSHSDESLLAYPGAESRVRQGITTELTGNCGSSQAPLAGPGADQVRKGWREYGVEADWTDVASYAAKVEKTGVAINHALLLGQGTLRENAVGPVDRPLRPEELQAVLRAVDQGMQQGAFGLSTGLEYTPGRYTPTEEIVDMARVVARHGGLYASHVRNEEAGLLEAVDEALTIGRRTGARVQVSHLKAAGKRHWDMQEAALDLLEAARRAGLDARADAYPYTAYSTGLTVYLDGWALDGGTDALMKRLRDPADRARIRREVEPRILREPGDYALIVLSDLRTPTNRGLLGLNLVQVAQRWNTEPVDAVLRLLEEEEGSVGYIGHGMSVENVERLMAHPLVMVSSDGYSQAPTGKATESRPHPRSYGTCPRVLAHYVRDRKVLDLPTAIKKMTSLPADQIGLRGRGRIGRGGQADLVAFDLAGLVDNATFEDPQRYPSGIRHVLVGGVPVVRDEQPTGARPGRMLRRG